MAEFYSSSSRVSAKWTRPFWNETLVTFRWRSIGETRDLLLLTIMLAKSEFNYGLFSFLYPPNALPFLIVSSLSFLGEPNLSYPVSCLELLLLRDMLSSSDDSKLALSDIFFILFDKI